MKIRTSRIIKKSLIISSIIFGTVIILFIMFYYGLFAGLASVNFDEKKLLNINTTLQIFDNQNNYIENSYSGNRVTTTLDKIPEHVIKAFISIEDKDFYKHNGINYKRIIKASLENIKSGKIKQGASTISQQLIKNTHLTNQKTFSRKLNEILLTQTLEKKYTKNQILENYLNVIYFGLGTFGIEQASLKYFDKSASELSIDEGAMLAGLIKAPATYSPVLAKESCKKRRNIVLNEMLKDKHITQEEFAQYSQKDINVTINYTVTGQNDYIDMALNEASKILKTPEKEITLNEYKIYTYMDLFLQNKANKIISNTELYPSITADGIIICLDSKTGGILTYKGKSKYNLNNSKRQPGSITKPQLVYGPALEYDVLTTSTPILDDKFEIDGYKPKNYNSQYSGYITTKQALSRSLNIPAVKTLNWVGINCSKFFADKLGLKLSDRDNGYSIALGGLTEGFSALKIANSYIPFSNNGNFVEASFIRKIEDKNGLVLYTNTKKSYSVMKESTAFLITDMLKEAAKTGTAKALNSLGIEVAAKTGTVGSANDTTNTDLWSVAYTPSMVVCSLICNTEGIENNFDKKYTGSGFPTIMTREFLKGQQNETFSMPKTVRKENLNSIDLYENNKVTLATPQTPEKYIIPAYFTTSNSPLEYSQSLNFINEYKIKVEIMNDCPTLTLDPKTHLTYKIYRKSEDIEVLLDTISNKSSLFSFADTTAKKGNFYSYYVVAEITKENNSITKNSNTVKIYFK